MASSRRKARIAALQALYEWDTVGHAPERTLERLVEEERLSAEAAAFARDLIEGVIANVERIDAIIAKAAPQWPVSQLAPIDRNILRIAVNEIVINNRTPIRAAINEAVELAKSFGSDNSAKFVNGVLGSVSLSVTRG
jgi:N utilization substance protein B